MASCRLWVTDLTYVATWQGSAYVAFIIASGDTPPAEFEALYYRQHAEQPSA